MGRAQDKAAIVTGAAAGIGRASARLLAREGARVVVTDINATGAEETVAQICADGGEATFLRHNVTVAAEWEAVVAATVATYGRLDILVNNAGVVAVADVENETLEGWRRTQAVNLDGVFLGTKHAVRQMKQNGGGSIVNISSIEGLVGEAFVAAYNASKGGVRLLTKSAALYCAGCGYHIRVNSVHPGFISTNLLRGGFDARGDQAEALMAQLIASVPLGRLGTPEDVAYAVLYLAADESRYVTGAELVIDGGFTAR
jgi:NAD(P)-dependent dehydrogenase (short-subunit alcohol dehydrogenase family)